MILEKEWREKLPLFHTPDKLQNFLSIFLRSFVRGRRMAVRDKETLIERETFFFFLLSRALCIYWSLNNFNIEGIQSIVSTCIIDIRSIQRDQETIRFPRKMLRVYAKRGSGKVG